ncbi:uncharacterized protein [Melanerpes formicivorus]|uniref:uncharacterized protein n=1 Tax=Melanerpes formicivorus TaxID=211600 RepID=UPI00358DF1E9
MPGSESGRGRREVSGDVCQGYRAQLQGLTLNSKSAITELTVLAKQKVAFASSIASLVEAQMAKAPPSQKLPVIYLMDSIVKHVGGAYLQAFAPNLVETFLSVFEKVDTETRKSLFLLRSTWDRVFPLEKLHALDVRVKSLDPAWPVTPLPAAGSAAGSPVSPQPAAPSQPVLNPVKHPPIQAMSIQFLQEDAVGDSVKGFTEGQRYLYAILEGNEPSAQPAAEGKAAEQQEDVPDLTDFQVEELRQRYSSAINALHTGIQCGSCGVRLATSQGYAEHLDWHYGQNRSRKAAGRAAAHRQWYCSSAEWIEFAAAADLQEPAKSQIFERAHEALLKARQAAKKDEMQSVPAGPAESCEICQEQFEQYWDDEEEEWRLRNAIRVDAKIYHPSCYKD